MKQVLLDVGAHHGESLQQALEFPFDEIHCYEPSAVSRKLLWGIAKGHDHVIVHPYGLWDTTTNLTLQHTGSSSASVFEDKPDNERSGQGTEPVSLNDASLVLKEFSDCKVWLKLNCEGAECPILERLLETKTINLVSYLAVQWDYVKIPSQRKRGDSLSEKLEKIPTLKFHEKCPQNSNNWTVDTYVRLWIQEYEEFDED